MTLVAIADLHETGDFTSTNHVVRMLSQLEKPDFVVFAGDILNYDYGYSVRWAPSKCNRAIDVAMAVVSKIGAPFMFTFGNHDATRYNCRPRLAHALSEHPLHVGVCFPGRATCIHPHLPIATLDVGLRNCRGNINSLGCPSEADTNWVGSHAAHGLIFTHYPPPAVLGRHVSGFASEQPCCWSQPKTDVLPPHSVHAFGHDHDNMYASVDKSLVALFKSGIPRYGPSFAKGPGLTVFNDQFVPTFYGSDGGNWTVDDLPLSKVGPECVTLQPRFVDTKGFFILVSLGIIMAALLLFGLIERASRVNQKRAKKITDASNGKLLLEFEEEK